MSTGPREPTAAETEATLDLEGRAVPLRLRRNPRARRLVLRIDPETEGAVLTLPHGVGLEEGLAMARRKGGWILARLDKLQPRIAFAPGAAVPYLGRPLTIRHEPGGRGGAWREGDRLMVSGRAEHVARRVADWLKAEAKRELKARARTKALLLGRKHGRVTVRDTRSRWGSCAAGGNLSFCWRLVMAPDWVLDYVVAHEVAHLAHHDHSPKFWKAVDRLCDHVTESKAWLKRHGPGLYRYG